MSGTNSYPADAPAPTSGEALASLAGGGEMGARIRAFDWTATSLGAPESWSHSLRWTVRLMLDARIPMAFASGPDFVQIYNDDCIPVFGSKHPAALGVGAGVSFHEVWDWVRPIYEHVATTGEPVYKSEHQSCYERHGYLEETYVTSSVSAVRDEAGGVIGVLTTMVETTERALAERRLRTLRDLGAVATEGTSPEVACATAAAILGQNALDLPFAILYLLDDSDATAYRAGITGLAPDDAAAPIQVSLASTAEAWPIDEVVERETALLVDDLPARFGVLECGPWPEKPHSALVIPLGRAAPGRAAGVLIAGISPRRVFDGPYRDFLQLVAGLIGTAVANARAREDERRRVEALAELDRAKTDFFNNISHEFRTPLTLMLGPLEQALAHVEGWPASVERKATLEHMRTAHRNSERLLALVDSLLDFARAEAGRLNAAFEPVDLPGYTAELASAFQSAVDSSGLRLTISCPPLPDAVGPVYVDRDLWERIVLNLISNAMKFTPSGEIAVSLRGDLATSPAGRQAWEIILTVRDTGVGIPAAELPHVFDRFYRVRGGGGERQGGTGIGLALVQELVHLHGGRIEVESEPGVGSSFAVALPAGAAHLPAEHVRETRTTGWTRAGARRPPADASIRTGRSMPMVPSAGDEIEQAISHSGVSRSDLAGSRIVLVDDNAEMRAYLSALLSPEYVVAAYSGVREALAAIERDPPDLVLSDVMMPEVDGFGLLRALRTGTRSRAVPVILLSARAGEEATVDGLNAGADDYLVKPFSARELLARVRAQIAAQRLRVLTATSAERERLARELHDSVAQMLLSAGFLAESVARKWERGREVSVADVRRFVELTRGASAEMRVLLLELRPEFLDKTPLPELLRQLADAAGARGGFAVDVRARDTAARKLPTEVRFAVYRIVQESLNNACRHSNASRVEIALTPRKGGGVECRVRDDGHGISEPPSAPGLGLTGMRERAAAVGAALHVGAAAAGGTEVRFLWPAGIA